MLEESLQVVIDAGMDVISENYTRFCVYPKDFNVMRMTRSGDFIDEKRFPKNQKAEAVAHFIALTKEGREHTPTSE